MHQGDEDSAVHPEMTLQPNAAKQDGSGQSVCNKQRIDMREATVQGSIVGNQGDITVNNYNYNAPGRQYPDKKIKVAAIEKHQLEHLNSLPESVVLYNKTAKQNQLPEVHPGMHHYDAYGGGDSSKEDFFIPSTQRKVADHLNQKPVSFNEIFTLTSQKKFIALIGPPASGKTTLSKRMAKLSHSNRSAKFLLRFMDLGYEEERLSYKQLFIDFLCPELDEETKENAFQWMRENPDKCVFVFDGYDQATWSLKNVKPLNASYDTHLPIDQLVANLCCKKFFKESLLIFTSRPYFILKIPSHLRPDVTVYVNGLSTADMKKLFYTFAGERAEKLWLILTTKAVQLFSLCQNPLLLQFIVFAVLQHGFKQVNTMTEVFQVVLEQLRYSEHAHGMDITEIWEPLCKMAYKGMQRRTVVFTINNLKEEGLDPTVLRDVIIAFARCIGFPTQRLFDGDQLFYFSHQMLQEMLAAKYISDFMPLKEFHTIIKQVSSEFHWSMVRRFLSGLLLGTNNRKDIQSTPIQSSVLPGQLSSTAEKSSAFLGLIIQKLPYTLNIEIGAYFFDVLIDLQECSDEAVALCQKHVPGVIILNNISISTGGHALAQILPRTNRPIERLHLPISGPNAIMWSCDGRRKIKYNVVRHYLPGNRVGDGCIQQSIVVLKRQRSGIAGFLS